jgi:hypothetical protein
LHDPSWPFLPFLFQYLQSKNKLIDFNVDNMPLYTDKKENQIFLIYEEIQSGAVAKSYRRKGFLIY